MSFLQNLPEWRLQQAAVLFVILGLCLASGVGRFRAFVTAHPWLALGTLVLADAALLLWATTPFVPDGIDECQFAVNSHVLRGADLGFSWMRTPLPSLGAAALPGFPIAGGILCKELCTLLAFLLARQGLGTGFGLLAALWTSIASQLAGNACYLLSEPYGALGLAAFALAAARGGRVAALGLIGGLAFASRWQLGMLWPFVVWLGWRGGRRWKGALLGTLLFLLPVLAGTLWMDADPLRAFQQESAREVSVLERLSAYLHPGSGLGLGIAGLVLAALGALRLLARNESRPELVWCAVLFLANALVVSSIGVITTRFFVPSVPLGAVLMASGAAELQPRLGLLRRSGWAALLLGAVSLSSALPVRAPKIRHVKQASLQ
ncbi:MAG: hypothetical protein ACE5F1_06425, partial [Planctomycetota bacterium]